MNTVSKSDNIPTTTVTLDTCKKLITKQCRATWQTRWKRANVGRATFDIMPQVGCKLYFPNDRCSAISYTRLLLDDSMLKAHQHRIGLEASNRCDCGLGIDDIVHFLLQYTLYDDLRQVLKHDVPKVGERCESRCSLNLSVQLLLFPFASDQLTYVECCDILSVTFNYIRSSQRQL